MENPLKVLLVEDSEDDAVLLLRELERGGYVIQSKRVETAREMSRLLKADSWDLVISDYSMPRFNALQALETLKASGLDLPFIIISGTIGEDMAVSAMKAGAHDYLLKGKLKKLIPVIQRELRDADERKKRRHADAALRETEHRYRSLFEYAPDGILIADPRSYYLDANASALRMLGYSRDELIGLHAKDIVAETEVPYVEPALDMIIAQSDYRREWQFRRKDGSLFAAEVRATTMPDGNLLGMIRDITERKEAEQAVKEAEEKYRSIFENAVEGIFQSAPDGRFISVNPALARILGYDSPEEVIAHRRDIGTQHYVHAAARAELEEMLSQYGVAVGYEAEIYRKDLSIICTVENVRVIRDVSGAVLYYEGSIEDITERTSLAEQLRQSQKLEAIGMLAGGVAHDFNNLLTIIGGYTDLALSQLPENDPLCRHLDEINNASERAASLTRQLLAFSRKQVLRPKVIGLNTIVADLEKMLRRMIGEDIKFRTNLRSGIGNVKADVGQIEQVIMNLVVNARDAMPTGGKLTIETDNVELDETYTRQHLSSIAGSYVLLAVSDTGTGIDEQTRKNIFEPFFTTKADGRGTGLGLSMVYGIVKQSGGNIWVYSEPGQGTTFKIYLPRVTEVAEKRRRTRTTTHLRKATETVLLVEDAQMVRALTKEVLETNGYHVIEAVNGKDALLIGEEFKDPIHLLLTDVVMPEMGGQELATLLVPLYPKMRVLYMSGYTEDTIVHHGVLRAGINFIEKPFSPDALALRVREVLDM